MFSTEDTPCGFIVMLVIFILMLLLPTSVSSRTFTR